MTADTTAETPNPTDAAHAQVGRAKRETGRIGLLGGTFDPPHLGHLIVGEQIRSACDLDEVWFVVANDPWQKSNRTVTPANVRLEMTAVAIGDTPGLVASDVEIGRGGPTFTVDTVLELQRRHPSVEWFVIVGRDAAAGLDTWERHDELAELAEFIVVERPGASGGVPDGFRCRSVSTPLIDISSTDIRDRVAAGQTIRFLVPEAVRTLIEARAIYRRPE